MAYSVEQVISKYLELRNQIAAIEEEQKQGLKPLRESMEKCKGWLQAQLISSGLQSAKTDTGTAYLKTDRSVKVVDQSELAGFMRERGITGFFKQQPDQAAIKSWLDDNEGKSLPGIEVSTFISVAIRQA